VPHPVEQTVLGVLTSSIRSADRPRDAPARAHHRTLSLAFVLVAPRW
jgi:hypothetical protein